MYVCMYVYMYACRKEGRKCFIWRRTKHILFTVIWRQTYGVRPLRERERKPATATYATLSDEKQGLFYIHHPTERIIHTTAFVTQVVEHWLEREIAPWVHPHDPSYHERTLLPSLTISIPCMNACMYVCVCMHVCMY